MGGGCPVSRRVSSRVPTPVWRGGRYRFAEPTGKFGNGAYKDEPWGLVAMRKRVYAVRSFYSKWLDEETDGALRDRNPGFAPVVVGTLNSLALLIGLEPNHVPKYVVQ